MRKCKNCGPQEESKFKRVNRSNGKVWIRCKKCDAERNRKYRTQSTDEYKERDRIRKEELKIEVFKHYSPTLTCSMCDEKHIEFLTIDHISGGGRQHRLKVGALSGGTKFYRWVKDNGFPDDLRVLCLNCNVKYGARRIQERPYVKPEFASEKRKYRVTYWEKNPEAYEKYKSQKRSYGLRDKLIVINHYGGKCSCCDVGDTDVLAIDHVNGGGTKHRKEINKTGSSFRTWLIKNNFPDGYQVLCFNCNSAKTLFGGCPHARR